jgi:hypothetical protein
LNFNGRQDDLEWQVDGDHFDKLTLTAPDNVEIVGATLNFTYSASDPSGITPATTSASPGLRIWTKDGNQLRNNSAVANGGDFVPAGNVTPSQIGLSDANRKVTLFVEATSASPYPSVDFRPSR